MKIRPSHCLRAFAFLLVLAFFSGLGLIRMKRGSGSNQSPEFQTILDEILSVARVERPPLPTSVGLTLACVYGNEHGRGLSLVDLQTLQCYEPLITNDITRLAGWSPDFRYLAFEQEPPFSHEILKPLQHGRTSRDDRSESWLTLYDRDKKSYWRLTSEMRVHEHFFTWLTTNSFFFSRDSDNNDLKGTYWGTLNPDSLIKVSEAPHEFVRMSDLKAAYLKEGNIFTFAISPQIASEHFSGKPTIRKLSNFKAGEFDSLLWLRYQSERNIFMFCSHPTNSALRYLFEFNPATQEVSQLNNEETYNGQWLANGDGFAYVGNSNNSFFLAVRTKNPSGHTNLFVQGSIANYTVDSAGAALYATASLEMEPKGTWEYNLNEHKLREITSSIRKPFNKCQIAEPSELQVKSFDGLKIPIFRFAPIVGNNGNGLRNGAISKEKHPVVIYLPPPTFQFQKAYEPHSQLMANLGFEFVAINFRGCDGYGKAFSDLSDPVAAAKDVLAVYDELIKDPSVDRQNVFLWSCSASSPVAFDLLALSPSAWSGVALETPASSPDLESFEPKSLPAMVIVIGDEDDQFSNMKKFHSWASDNTIDLKLVVLANNAHSVNSSISYQIMYGQSAEFFCSHLRR
jgi:Prolyl oligopeptidase family